MNPETEPISRPSNRQQVAHVTDVLTRMQRSGSIHFMQSLPKTAFQTSTVTRSKLLNCHCRQSLYKRTVKRLKNGSSFEHIYLVEDPQGHGLCNSGFTVGPLEEVNVQIAGGWPAFVAANRLKEGDYLIFPLKEDARSEFEVYMFRGPWGSPYFPKERERSSSEEENVSDSEGDSVCESYEEENVSEYFPNEGERSDSEEEDNANNQTRQIHSPVHQQEEHNQAFTRDIREGNPAPLQPTENPRVHPGFSRRLTAYNIGRSDGTRNSGQFEFPKHFIRTHGGQVHDFVKLQGIHENSRNYVITCRRRPGNHLKVYFGIAEWNRFVQDNGIKEGHELRFSLVAKSYLVVRKIS